MRATSNEEPARASRSRSLPPRWLLVGVGLALACLLGGGIWFLLVQENHLKRGAEAELQTIARLKVDQIVQWRTERLGDAAVLAQNPFFVDGVRRWLAAPQAAEAAPILGWFRSLQEYYHYSDILFVDAQAHVQLSLSGSRGALHAEAAEALAASLRDGRALLTDLHVGPEGLPPHLDAIAPVFTGDGREPLGGLVLRSDARQFLYPMIQSWPVPSRTAETLLIRRDGEDALYLNELRHRSDAAFKLRIPLSRSNVPAVAALMGKKGLFRGQDYRGVEVLSVLQAVPGSSWHLEAKVDLAEVSAGWRRSALVILGMVFGLAAAAAASAGLIWQRSDKAHFLAIFQAEARYRTTLLSVGDGVISTDAQGRVELMNPAAEALTGWSAVEARNRPLEEIFSILNEQTGQGVENPVRRVLREGMVVGLANRTVLVARDGTRRPIADSGAPIREEGGETSGVVLVFRDQTRERTAQRMLQESEGRFRSLFEHMLNGFAYCRMLYEGERPVDFIYLDVNDAFQTLTGLKDVVGKRVSEVIPGLRESDPQLFEVYGRVAATGRPESFETYVKALEMWFSISVYSPQKEHFVTVFDVITERKKAEEALRKSEERFRTTLDNMMEGCQIIGPDWRYLYVNRAAAEQGRQPGAALLGRTMSEAYPGIESTSLFTVLQRCMRDRVPEVLENEFAYPDGGGWFQLAIQPVPEGLFILSIDITERKRAAEDRERLQAQLVQAQKMESVGRLAGGVAHDFNNMLTVILGFAEHALTKLVVQDPLHRNLTEIRTAAQRSAEVVNKLLAFSRRQTIAPKILSLNECLKELELLLRRILGEDIDLRVALAPDLWPVSLDPSQLEQAAANLAVNSRDAMPEGGMLTIETANVSFDQAYCGQHPGFLPGEYVLLAVSDNGCGMDKETLAQAFEPFFTTKPEGQGTGLGLSTVYGIVRQNGGFINMYSEPGNGTTAKLYFRRYRGEPESAARGMPTVEPAGGQETILLVEDEDLVRELAVMALEPLGYTVLAARGPQEALALCESHPGEIDLLLTDVVLPVMNGRLLQARVSELKPRVKVLFMSGYTANAIAHRGVLDKGIQFLQKPFSLEALARKVREALDQS
jgi:two-component system cell cycle sensor histidine kinase/response regulator CckA